MERRTPCPFASDICCRRGSAYGRTIAGGAAAGIDWLSELSASAYHFDVLLGERHPLLAAEQLQQNLDSLARPHAGIDPQKIAERTMQNPDSSAGAERGAQLGNQQLDVVRCCHDSASVEWCWPSRDFFGSGLNASANSSRGGVLFGHHRLLRWCRPLPPAAPARGLPLGRPRRDQLGRNVVVLIMLTALGGAL